MTKEYMTVQGDMWDGIAKKTLGNEYYMTDLIDANLAYREIVVFPANIRLVIPEVEAPAPQVLPPWKQGGS